MTSISMDDGIKIWVFAFWTLIGFRVRVSKGSFELTIQAMFEALSLGCKLTEKLMRSTAKSYTHGSLATGS
jgi:hypothetical protein